MGNSIFAKRTERKRGEWLRHDKLETMRCSKCDIVYGQHLYPRNYCPNCGADMRGVKDGKDSD